MKRDYKVINTNTGKEVENYYLSISDGDRIDVEISNMSLNELANIINSIAEDIADNLDIDKSDVFETIQRAEEAMSLIEIIKDFFEGC